MTTRLRRTHWLRSNRAARIPRRIICLDSEAITKIAGRRETHSFRLAFATFDELDPTTLEIVSSDSIATLDVRELWTWIESKCSRRHRTVLFAHNLAYDLRLCCGLEELPQLGWELRGFALDRYRCWARWRKGDLALSMADTMSYVGRALDTFAKPFGIAKRDLPSQADTLSVWLARCETDTRLLREIVLRYLRFIRDEECGDFRLSGPAQGFAQFRHRFMPEKTLLVHEDEDQLERERESAWTGRCEVWQHGSVDGTLYEWDYQCAYARIAATSSLPVRYRGTTRNYEPLSNTGTHFKFALLCRCVVTSDLPCLPTRASDRIRWAVGRFETLLWDVEIDAARECGATVEILECWAYKTAPLLQEWGTYILDQLEGRNGDLCPVARAALKQWSRSLIGRFGLRYPVWSQVGETNDHAFQLIRYKSADDDLRGQWLRLGKQVFDHSGSEESYDSSPAVMSYIMAVARVKLWRAMLAADLGNIVYVDTDSIIVHEEGNARLAQFSATEDGHGLRLKAQYDGGVFFGPRQIMLGDETRIAGLPKKAKPVAENEWKAVIWEGATHALERGEPSQITVTERTIRLRGLDTRREHLDNGRTAAFVAA